MGKFGPPLKWLSDQREKIQMSEKDLSGKNVLVVGANVGLGFEVSKHFASMKPAKLIMACRNQVKGEEAVKDHIVEVQSSTGCMAVELWLVDLTDFASIKAFVSKFETNGISRLDIAIVNAGILTPNFVITGDGWETTLQTNHLGTALLSLLILPLLSLTLHHPMEVDQPNIMDALNDKKRAVMSQRYYVAKLLNLFFAQSVASKLSPDKLLVVSVNPGFCKTRLTRNAGVVEGLGLKLATALLARSAEMGSRCLLHAAFAADKHEVHGKYLNNCRVEEESDFVISDAGAIARERVWKETVEILSKVDNTVDEIVERHLSKV